MYDKTITIVNRIIGSGNTDAWKKTVINNAEYQRVMKSVINENARSFQSVVIVLIPFGNGYVKYQTWKNDTSSGFTVSNGDIIFLGTVPPETITNANASAIIQRYSGSVFQVLNVTELEDNGIATVQLKVDAV